MAFILIGGLFATVAYVVALKKNQMAMVDLVWSLSIGVGGLFYAVTESVSGDGWNWRLFTVTTILCLWAFRLSLHLYTDRIRSGCEDARYANLSNYWGSRAKRNFYFLFIAQILLAILFLIPVIHASSNPKPFGSFCDILGISIACIALLGETVADQQLADFRSNEANRGRVCSHGLWRFSRHPNYFFEWIYWWSFVAFAWGASGIWVSLLGPACMYLFLRFLTGIPHAERSSLRKRGEAYRLYQQSTNMFFPWIPRQRQF